MKRKPLFRRKEAKRDFQESDLPSNRFEVFFDVLKNHYRTLLGVSLILLLFFFPLLAGQFYLDLSSASLLLSLNAGELAEADYISQSKLLNQFSMMLLPVGMTIASIGLAGCARIVKRLCFLEPVFFFDDFKRGVKENGLHFALTTFGFAALLALSLFLLGLNQDNFLGALFLGLVLLFAYPTYLVYLPSSSFYSMKFASSVGLSFRVMFRSYGILLPYLLVFLTPFGLQFVGDVVLKYLLLLATVLLSGAVALALFLFTFSRLDKYINKTHYPEWVDKGIHRKKKD